MSVLQLRRSRCLCIVCLAVVSTVVTVAVVTVTVVMVTGVIGTTILLQLDLPGSGSEQNVDDGYFPFTCVYMVSCWYLTLLCHCVMVCYLENLC